MPPTVFHRRARSLFGPDCVFGIVDWKGFLGNLAGNYATITGTLAEVETPYGTGISVAAANSYVTFNWASLAPIATSQRSAFVRFYLPDVGNIYCQLWWGTNAVRDGTYLITNHAVFQGGIWTGTTSQGGVAIAGWNESAMTNIGTNGFLNSLYADGVLVDSDANAADLVTSYSALTLFRVGSGGVLYQCPIGTVIQEVLVFNRVLAAGEILNLHRSLIGE